MTVYLIGGRGYEDACQILGEDFAGVLERDGWAPYRSFKQACHQTCYAHLLKRTAGPIEDSIAGQARVPHAARRILKDALALRERRDAGLGDDVIDAEETGLKVTELGQRTDKLLEIKPTHEPNRLLIEHLRTEREHMFTFLEQPGVQATNWRAEQALRPAIVNPTAGRQPHRRWRAHPGDRDQRDPHRPPAERRPDRADGSRPARPDPDRRHPATDPHRQGRPRAGRIADAHPALISAAQASLPSHLLRDHRRGTEPDHGLNHRRVHRRNRLDQARRSRRRTLTRRTARPAGPPRPDDRQRQAVTRRAPPAASTLTQYSRA